MSDYKFLAQLLDIQAQPGVDQEENLLLLSLVSLLGIVSVMQKQLVNQESNLIVQEEIKNNREDLAVNYGNRIKEIKPSIKKNKELKSIENNPHKDVREKNKANDKIVNKIKWDSRLKKKIKEPLYI